MRSTTFHSTHDRRAFLKATGLTGLALTAPVTTACGDDDVASATDRLKDDARRVGAWYITVFYSAGFDNQHWRAVRDRGGALPLGGPESSADPVVMERQFCQMQECGIEFLVMDDTNCVWVDNSRIDGLIRTWFDFMDSKPAQERIPIAIAAGGELNQHNRREAWTKAVEYLWQTFAARPSYMRVGGKPVLHWYVEKDVWPEWTDARWTIRRTNHFFWSARQALDGGWGYGTDPSLPGIKECMSFWPGWDLSPPGISREGGGLYRRQWIKALKLQPRHVLLSDWCGWCEGTAIEDSDRWTDTYGDPAPAWYRLMTQGYIAAYNGRLVKGFYYRDQAQGHVYRWDGTAAAHVSAYPRGIPVIVLPEGMLTSLSQTSRAG